MCLDEPGLRQALFERAQNGIESLHMTYLQNDSPVFGEFHQLQRLFRCFGDRFFDKKMFSFMEQKFSNLVMIGSWSRNGSRVDHAGEFAERGRHWNSMFSRNRLGSLSICIEDGSELHTWEFRIDARVIFPNASDADNSCSDELGHSL